MSRELMVEGLNVFKMFSRNRKEIPDYGMFTDAGNKAIHGVVTRVMSNPTATDSQKYEMAQEMMSKLRIKHKEAMDTAVRDAVWTAITGE